MALSTSLMQACARGIDRAIQAATGKRYGFSIIVWPLKATERCSYVSNTADRAEIARAMEQLLKRWKEGMPDIPADNVN